MTSAWATYCNAFRDLFGHNCELTLSPAAIEEFADRLKASAAPEAGRNIANELITSLSEVRAIQLLRNMPFPAMTEEFHAWAKKRDDFLHQCGPQSGSE